MQDIFEAGNVWLLHLYSKTDWLINLLYIFISCWWRVTTKVPDVKHSWRGKNPVFPKYKCIHSQTGTLNFTARSREGLGRAPEEKVKFCGNEKKAGFSFDSSNIPIFKTRRQIQIFSNQVCQFFLKSHLDFLWFRSCFYISFVTALKPRPSKIVNVALYDCRGVGII